MKKNTKNKYRQDFQGDQSFDYKDPVSLSRFISDGGKITPARISKLSLAQQRRVSNAVKKARSLALLPSGAIAYDLFYKAENINSIVFEI